MDSRGLGLTSPEGSAWTPNRRDPRRRFLTSPPCWRSPRRRWPRCRRRSRHASMAPPPRDQIPVIATLAPPGGRRRLRGHPAALLRALRAPPPRRRPAWSRASTRRSGASGWSTRSPSRGRPVRSARRRRPRRRRRSTLDVKVHVTADAAVSRGHPLPRRRHGRLGPRRDQGPDGVDLLRPARRGRHDRQHRHRRQREPSRTWPGRSSPGTTSSTAARRRSTRTATARTPRAPWSAATPGGAADRRRPGRAPGRRPRDGRRRRRLRAAPCWPPPSG